MARRLGSRNRREEQRVQLAMLTRLEAVSERQFQRVIGGTMHGMSRWVEDGNSVDIYKMTDHRERVGNLLAATWERSGTAFGQRILDACGKAHGRHAIQTKDLPDAFLEGLRQFQRRWLAQDITQISRPPQSQPAATL